MIDGVKICNNLQTQGLSGENNDKILCVSKALFIFVRNNSTTMKTIVFMRKIVAVLVVLMLFQIAWGQETADTSRPKAVVPDEQLAYFDLRGPVREVTEYALGDYSKMVWTFDIKGRLTEYRCYGNPFAGDGGCVFRLMAHYKYAYDKEGKIVFLYTFAEDYNLDESLGDEVLELFPPKMAPDALREQAEMLSDSTLCHSVWGNDSYSGRHYDRYRNWTECVEAPGFEEEKARLRVRNIVYYTDAELLGLPNGVKKVTYCVESDGSVWESEYSLDREGHLLRFQSYRDREPLYDWAAGQTDSESWDLITPKEDVKGKYIVEWWQNE